jgi:O-antigen/teichoic acid export membrane protein
MPDYKKRLIGIPIDSLNKRYLFKLISKVITAPLTIIIQAIMPRGLGPESYGNFIYQTNIFQQVITFFDSGTSLAFYTGLSKNLEDRSLIKFYGGYSVISTILVLLCTSIVLLLKLDNKIFLGQEIQYVYMALFFAAITWWSEIIYKIIDAYGLTVKGERILIYQRFISVLVLGILYYLEVITLLNIFIFNYVVLLILIIWWTRCLHKNGILIFHIPSISKLEIKKKSIYFWSYSSPLLIYSFSSMLMALFDNWLLMKIAGPVQQGYFGLAFKVSSISFMFTGAMTQLITREFSIAHSNNDKIQLASLFEKYIPVLYFMAAFFSAFFIANAGVVTNLFGGVDFKDGVLPIAIMLFYPIHQTYGQLSGSLYYATNQTKLYRNIGVFMVPIGMVLSWITFGPNEYFGLGMGALGLALKTVFLQFIAVNTQLYFNTNYLGITFLKYLWHQLYVVLTLLGIAFLSRWSISIILNSDIISSFFSGGIYFILTFGFLYFFPQSIALSKEQRDRLLNKFAKLFQSKFNI